ncbi:hypothetical protein DPMN_090973 [Dreissena polymorpha]|uniref:Uncharacterized protein n=1 Tax=Dreissena polymorpha TaxID=45954 RepID=A0A9D4QYT0_DREPO|nr:hypothetical protein DPMN_090973 [Dreissena polymorpha]
MQRRLAGRSYCYEKCSYAATKLRLCIASQACTNTTCPAFKEIHLHVDRRPLQHS